MPTVLFVEDTPEMQRIYQTGMEHEGFTVETVASAGEALAKVEGGAYDIIVLDLMLGGMSGLDFLKTSGIRFKAPNTKIVILTQIDSPDVMERVAEAGVDRYLIKARTEPTQLAMVLKELIPGATPPAPAAGPAPVPPAAPPAN